MDMGYDSCQSLVAMLRQKRIHTDKPPDVVHSMRILTEGKIQLNSDSINLLDGVVNVPKISCQCHDRIHGETQHGHYTDRLTGNIWCNKLYGRLRINGHLCQHHCAVLPQQQLTALDLTACMTNQAGP